MYVLHGILLHDPPGVVALFDVIMSPLAGDFLFEHRLLHSVPSSAHAWRCA